MTIIAENLKKLMSSADINTTDLSRKTGVDQSVIHRILNGITKNPSTKSIAPILEYFNVSLENIASGSNERWQRGELPIISWSEATSLPLKPVIEIQQKFIKTNKKVSETAFALLIDHDIDSRFQKGTLLIVCPDVQPKNRSYVIIQENSSEFASLKHYIIDGNTAYLKPIDTALPTAKYDEHIFRIIGVVVQYIFDFE